MTTHSLLASLLVGIALACVAMALAKPAAFFPKLLSLDATLAGHGFPALSPIWSKTLRAFFDSACRVLIVRGGRRSGKSTTSCKTGVAWALYGNWSVPPGDVGVIAILSVDRVEAGARLRTISAMLDALGVRYTRRVDELELLDRPVLFQIVSATVTGGVGRTYIMIIGDEVARWRDVETGANPAREVIASLAPGMATQPGARMLLLSSPWSTTDYHAERFARGDDGHQMVACFPSWIGNPTLTEADTHALEPDPRIWSREYAAQPSDAISSICSAAEYDACIVEGVTRREVPPGGRVLATMDPGMRHDRWVVSLDGREMHDHDGRLDEVIVQYGLLILKPTFLHKITLEEGIGKSLAFVRSFGVDPRKVAFYSDSHYSDAIAPALAERGVRFVELKNTPAAISARIASLQVRLTSRRISLLDNEDQRKEMLGAQLVMHAGGRLTLKAPERRGMHDDTVSATLLACDEVTTVKLPFNDSDIIVRHDVGWYSDTKELIADVRYFTRGANGSLIPREPPYGTPAYAEWAERMLAQGAWTESLRKWVAEGEANKKGN